MTQRIEISPKSITYTIFLLLGLYVLFLIKDVVIGVFVAILIMSSIHPFVLSLQKRKIPRSVAIWIAYFIFLAVIALLGLAVIPSLVKQTASLVNNIPTLEITRYLKDYQIELADLQVITQQLGSLPRLFSAVSSTFSFLITAITVMVMTFYLLVERQSLHKHLHWFFRNRQSETEAEAFVNKVEMQIGHWVRGQLTLMLVVGFLVYIGLVLLGIPYALPLAILAGMLEVIPNIGPTVSAVPAVMVAFTVSPIMSLVVLLMYIIIQQLENGLIVPQIMRKATGINPIVTIFLVLSGYRLAGPAGAILAIPSFLVAKVIAQEYYDIRINSSDTSVEP